MNHAIVLTERSRSKAYLEEVHLPAIFRIMQKFLPPVEDPRSPKKDYEACYGSNQKDS